MKRAMNGWFTAASNTNVGTESVSKKPRLSQPKISNTNSPKARKQASSNFIDKLGPKIVSDLAVHPKKVKEVEGWLQENVVLSNKKNARFLLLTGPSGCGKTATVKVLCKTLKIEIFEWVNRLDKDYEIGDFGGQIEQFSDFLVTSKYSPLFSNSKQIILIEDVPNSLLHDPNKLVVVLEKYCLMGTQTALIFICTECNNDKVNLPQKLFPQEVRECFKINHISFNECSVTLLKSALKRVQNITKELDAYKVPNQSVIDAVVASSMGDIRCALNQYYFACLKGVDNLPVTAVMDKTTKKRGNNKKLVIQNMSRDETLGLFHSLGRVFNPKRIETNGSWRLKCDLQKLIDEFSIQPQTFSNFLFENYTKYFGSLNDACKSVELVSLSRVFLEKYCERHENVDFSLWIAVMGLMIYNEHGVSKWTQISAPPKIKKWGVNDIDKVPPTDRCYYNIINKTSSKFHSFKCKK